MKSSLADDGRLLEAQRLARREQELSREAVNVREELAAIVTSLLPPHAPEAHVVEVVEATGYSRTLIDGLRGGKHPWHAPANRV